MKNAISILAVLAAVTAVLPAHATEQTKTSSITSVYPVPDGSFYITLADIPAECTNTNSPKRLHVKVGENAMTADAMKQIYAAALVAVTADLTVYVAYDDATSSCYVNRLRVFKS